MVGSSAELGRVQQRAADAAARDMWERDGKPEVSGTEPGSVGLRNYRQWANDTVTALQRLGYTVTPPPLLRANSNQEPK